MPLEKDKYIRFFLEAMPDAKRSAEEGRPIFKDEEMVEIRLVGDRENTIVARAHEPFMMNRAGSDEYSQYGSHLTYAQRWPDHYKAFQANNQEIAEGTPIDHLPFLSKSQVAEFRAQNIRTVEGLSAVPDRLLTGKMGWRVLREQAKVWLEDADKMALVTKANAESDELRARLAKLEAMLAQQAISPDQVALSPDGLDTWTDEALREFLTDRGVALRANASRVSMIGAVREFTADS